MTDHVTERQKLSLLPDDDPARRLWQAYLGACYSLRNAENSEALLDAVLSGVDHIIELRGELATEVRSYSEPISAEWDLKLIPKTDFHLKAGEAFTVSTFVSIERKE
jgi:hypothetical protein